MALTIIRRHKEMTFGELSRGELLRRNCSSSLLYQKCGEETACELTQGNVQPFAKSAVVVRINADLEWWDA